MKNEKGITLIALIITIIVMLILVGVTINIAINGGLFDTARDAGTGMQKAVEEEELMSVAISAYSARNDSVTVSELTSAIDTEKFEYDSEKTNANVYVVKGKKSGTIWQIDLKTAEVTEYVEKESNDELGELFILYYKNVVAGTSNSEVIQRASELGVTEQDLINALGKMKNFTDEIENCGYAYTNHNNIDYLYKIDYSTGNATYIPRSNTEKYAMLSNLFLIRDELKQKLNGMTSAQVDEIFDNPEAADAFVRKNSNAIITSVDRYDINGIHKFCFQYNDQEIFEDIIIYDP